MPLQRPLVRCSTNLSLMHAPLWMGVPLQILEVDQVSLLLHTCAGGVLQVGFSAIHHAWRKQYGIMV